MVLNACIYHFEGVAFISIEFALFIAVEFSPFIALNDGLTDMGIFWNC